MLEASRGGLLIGYAGVRWIGNLAEEFVIFQHALVKERKGLSSQPKATETIINDCISG